MTKYSVIIVWVPERVGPQTYRLNKDPFKQFLRINFQNLIFTLEVALIYYNTFSPSNMMLKNTH